MKKLLITFGVIIVIILAAAFIIPIAFKDDIKAAIDEALAESVNADIVWDTDDFSISLFTNFPNATAGLNNFGVINRAPFAGEILFAVEKFEVEIDIMSLFGDQIKINGIELDRPEINVIVLEDGSANYDIAVASEEEEVPEEPASEEPTKFNVGIDHWAITNGHLVYDDATLPFKMELKGLNHSGSGDFNQDVFDLSTLTAIDSVSVNFDGVEYLSHKTFNADIVMSISDNYGRYTFKENNVGLNDFNLGFDGFLALNEDGSMDMDLTYGTKETTFKSLLSLVPGIYTADFGSIETAGNLAFNGLVKGKYSEEVMPAFNLALQVNEAMFKYPDLPTAISNISMDLAVVNDDGVIDNTMVNLKQFHMDFGNNPFDAKMIISNLVDYNMDANVKGQLNLAELSSMFPMEGMSMKGIYAIDLSAKGTYDSVSGKTPVINATMSMKDGYVKTADLPYALEDLKFAAEIMSPTGLMKDFKAVVKDFGMTMDGEPFGASLEFWNLDNYNWNVDAHGGIDLEKITKVFPLEGMTLAGVIRADLTTAGNMTDLEAERYDKLPTSGNVSINNFKYVDSELPYEVTISSAKASFDPKQMALENYSGTIGKSDISMNGAITNYIGYLFGENETLRGNLNLSSNLLDLNEFMSDEEVAEETTEEAPEESMGVVEVPKNIDFVMTSDIKTVAVMDMSITNAKGKIVVRNGIVSLDGLNFNLLEGAFAMSGSYDPTDLEKPKYDFKFKVDDLSSQKAFETFSIVQSYFPIAKNVNGKLSTDFKVSGLLDQEMFPDMETVSGGGLLNLAQAKVLNSNLLKGIGNTASISSLSADEINIKDILMNVSIEDGKVNVKPFDLDLGGYKANIGGSSTLAGGLDFNLKMDVPAGKLGSAANDLVAKYTGGSSSGSSVIPLTFGIGGTYDNPTYKLKGTGSNVKATDVAKVVAKEAVEEKLGVDLDEEKEKQREKIMADAKKQADRLIAEGKSAADKVREEGYKQADNLIKEAGSNPIKKKIAEVAAKKLRTETDEKAAKIEAESKEKADKLLAEAQKKADAV